MSHFSFIIHTYLLIMSYRIIGYDGCPYCDKVKKYFKTNKIPYEWIDSETPEGEKIREAESAKYNYSTVPMVYIDGKFIGGCDDFFKKNGK